jgi:ribokinase
MPEQPTSSRLVVIGSANVDVFARVARHPVPGETVVGEGGDRLPGGKGANQALAAGLQGAPVVFVAAVGDDPDAEVALGALRGAGVDLTSVSRAADRPTGVAIITVADSGENTIVVLPGANSTVTPDDAVAAVGAMTGGDVLLVQGELPRATTEAAVRAAHAAGHRVVLNVAPWGALDHDVLTAADPLVLNEHEAVEASAALGLPDDGDFAVRAGAMIAAGVPSVVITLGARGAVAGQGERVDAVGSPRVPAVDTTGAGDAFTGALAARLLGGDSLLDAAAHATRVAAFSVGRVGAQPSYPSTEDPLPGDA